MNALRNIVLEGVEALSEAFQEGEASPVDIFAAYKQRISDFNPALNAFLHLRLEEAEIEARASTERWRAGEALSRLDGVPFGVKANIAVADLPWHGGIAAYRERIARRDAQAVANLRKAGAIPIGVLNMHEGALGATTDNIHFGRCYNPWGNGLTPGGSSGGSGAAVAAGLCAFSLGTDTMGSVRIPSAYCGVAGLKPSYGAVPATGLVDLSPMLDHIGPHARTAADLKLILSIMTGAAPPSSKLPIRFGVADWKAAVDVTDDVDAAFQAATETIMSLGEVSKVDLSVFDFGALRRRGLLISEVEGHRAHRETLEKNPAGFSDAFRGLLEWGAGQPKEKLDAAYADIRNAGAALNALFDDVDVIVAPTAPQGPFPFEYPVPSNQADFTCIANFSGGPAVAVPAGGNGAPPASVQFIARKGRDETALAAAIAYEDARGVSPYPPHYA